MPSEKVIDALDRLGIEVSSEEFGHYGVPGMRWGKRKSYSPEIAKARADIKKMAEEQGLVYNKKTDSYSSPGAPKTDPVTAARIRDVAVSKGASISDAQRKADARLIKKDDKKNLKIQDQRLKGVSRIMDYGGNAKGANRSSRRELTVNLVRNTLALGLTGAALSFGAPIPIAAGLAAYASLNAAGKLNQTLTDIRNVNSAAEVFNPNTLLNLRNNG